ncbi:hypothetical protein BTUL_0031g00320 [Botrytis tulipae]|uniref:Uncharacterized protein n=1 Tax=Botrytis tulipae TaxID=87230 RepID=A0A4Z1F4Y3_9HELO|nr:hypothetical protein BTUL_0031g00320 [Botrytis tulipae]
MKVTQQIFAFLSTVSLVSAQLPSCAVRAGISIASTLPSCPSSTSGAPSASNVIPTTGARTTSESPSTTSSIANSTDATTPLSAGTENQQLQSRLQAGGAILAILVLNFL